MGIDIESLITAVGYPGLFLIVFAETGLLIGFFLPGDSLLITTGLLIQRGHLEVAGHDGIFFIIPVLIVAAILGDATGYQIGKHTGPRIFTRDDSRFFKRDHLEKARQFYDKHGGKTIILARFLALVRTFAPTVAGAANMPYHRFAMYNIVGGVLWVPSMTLLGYFVGTRVEHVEAVIVVLVGIVILISLAPAGWHFVRSRRTAARREA